MLSKGDVKDQLREAELAVMQKFVDLAQNMNDWSKPGYGYHFYGNTNITLQHNTERDFHVHYEKHKDLNDNLKYVYREEYWLSANGVKLASKASRNLAVAIFNRWKDFNEQAEAIRKITKLQDAVEIAPAESAVEQKPFDYPITSYFEKSKGRLKFW